MIGFDFTDVHLLCVSQLMEKTEFRIKATWVAKGRKKVEKEMNKTTKTHEIASAVMEEMFKPDVDQGRAYVRYVCEEILKHPTFMADLVVGLACFEFCVLFTLPRSQAAEYYCRIFQSSWVRAWVSKEFDNIHKDDYMGITSCTHQYLYISE